MKEEASLNKPTIVALLLLLFLLLTVRLGSPSIYILDEAKNAQCAKEMLQRNDFIVPTFNGELRVDKPPLHYFFMIAAYKIFGVSSLSARFFSVVMGVLTVLSTMLFANRYLNRQAAFFTGLVLLCSTHFILEFRLAVPDPFLIFFTTAGLMSAFVWVQEKRTAFLYIAAVCLGFGTLAKGPVAVVLPAISLFLFSLIKKDWSWVKTWHLAPALLLFAAIALPWYLAVHAATNGEWTKGFFLEHNLSRFSSSREGHGGFFLLPLVIALVGLLPFSVFAGEIVRKRRQLFHGDAVLFALLVFAVVVVFFSFSATKLPNYAMLGYSFGALLLGHYLQKVYTQTVSFPAYPFFILVAFYVLIPVAGTFALRGEVQTRQVAPVAAVLFVPALLLLYFIWRIKLSTVNLIYSVAAVFVLFNALALWLVYPAVYRNNPVTKTLRYVQPAGKVLAYGLYNPAYNFYLSQPVERVDREKLNTLLATEKNWVLVTRASSLPELEGLPLRVLAREHDIFETAETVVLSP